MVWKKGESGNPKGRPPKRRALTEILLSKGSKTVVVDGKHISRKIYVANEVWRLLVEGKVRFLDGRVLEVERVDDWVNAAKWLYMQIEGMPKINADITTGPKIVLDK